MSGDATFELEFNRLARWTADAILAGPPADAIAGACNGSGRPSALAWLADGLQVGPDTVAIDTGAGLGGPAAWLRQHRGVLPFVAEPMSEAARGARRLFGLPAVVAWSDRLPFRSGRFDAAFALAVLSTASDKGAYLREVHRILRPGGGLGVLEYVVTVGEGPVAPENNELLEPAELDALLTEAGFAVVASVWAASLPEPPPSWREAEARVKRGVQDAHGRDRRLAGAEEQETRFARLLADGTVEVRLVQAVAVRRPARDAMIACPTVRKGVLPWPEP